MVAKTGSTDVAPTNGAPARKKRRSTPTKVRPRSQKQPDSELLSRADLARRKGVSRAAVTLACRDVFPDAVVGKRVNAQHPDVAVWLGESPRGPDGVAAESDPPTREEMQRLQRRKKAAEAERLELQNAQTREDLISRELVKTHVFGAIDAANKRLLGDSAKTITRRVYAMAKAGEPVVAAEKVVRELISAQLVPVRSSAARTLRSDATVSQHAATLARVVSAQPSAG